MTFKRSFYATKKIRGLKRASDRRRMLKAEADSSSRSTLQEGGGSRLFVTSPDDDAADMLRGVDLWTTRVVEEQSMVPLEIKLFPVIDTDGNCEFEVNHFADVRRLPLGRRSRRIRWAY
ncbi:hypothetical protein T492DRAFT_840841 [Pavlovales sp. CCMP2436]|nr:hypothetical protein T492DRAFT_840841 [Pavlovales sp. CCMP2436]